jgi:aerobic-type carbon monoxide dehydrogenase small subunit (CoxS/CutS family)
MASTKITVNSKEFTIDADPDMPMLWVLRDKLGLTGTKFGCGMGVCGACTIHMDGEPVRSCLTPLSAVEQAKITTIEGLSSDRSHPIQQAWIAEQVPQCGYCQSGQIMEAAALLTRNSNPSDEEIDKVMEAILCRCGTYQRIRKAIHRAAAGGAK